MTFRIISKDRRPELNRYLIDNQEVSKEAFDAACPDKPLGGVPGGHLPSCWPMTAMLSAVLHPSQVSAARAACAKVGVPTDFKDGAPIWRDAKHRKEYCEKVERELSGVKLVDRNGGYGDPQ